MRQIVSRLRSFFSLNWGYNKSMKKALAYFLILILLSGCAPSYVLKEDQIREVRISAENDTLSFSVSKEEVLPRIRETLDQGRVSLSKHKFPSSAHLSLHLLGDSTETLYVFKDRESTFLQTPDGHVFRMKELDASFLNQLVEKEKREILQHEAEEKIRQFLLDDPNMRSYLWDNWKALKCEDVDWISSLEVCVDEKDIRILLKNIENPYSDAEYMINVRYARDNSDMEAHYISYCNFDIVSSKTKERFECMGITYGNQDEIHHEAYIEQKFYYPDLILDGRAQAVYNRDQTLTVFPDGIENRDAYFVLNNTDLRLLNSLFLSERNTIIRLVEGEE